MEMDNDMSDGSSMPHGVLAPERGPLLPATAKHGLAHRLRQYPVVGLAAPGERAAAEQLRRELFKAAQRWADPRAAEAAGFDLRRARRAPGERRVMWFHSENRRFHAGRGSFDPSRPDTLIYADLPGRPLRLVGAMISMPRGLRGPDSGWADHPLALPPRLRHRPRAGTRTPRPTAPARPNQCSVWAAR